MDNISSIITFFVLILLTQTNAQVLDECSDPPAISNGNVVTVGPYGDNSTAVYNCHTGYTMAGVADGLTCYWKVWSGIRPTCVWTSPADVELQMWVIVGLVALMALLMLIALIIMCVLCFGNEKKHNVVRVAPSNNDRHYVYANGSTERLKA